MRMDDEVVRVAVGLQTSLGYNLCELHNCSCQISDDSLGRRGLSCRMSAIPITADST